MTSNCDARAERWSACDLRALLSRCSAGDERARETIILRFLPLARRLARVYEGRGGPIQDLCQAASVGLIKAIDQYSPERGDAFPAYARPMILGEIRRHFRDTTWRVHVPRSVKERAGGVRRAETEFSTTSGSARTDAIAGYLGLDISEVAEARLALEAYSPSSLDETYVASGHNALPLREIIGADDHDYERVEISLGIRVRLSR